MLAVGNNLVLTIHLKYSLLCSKETKKAENYTGSYFLSRQDRDFQSRRFVMDFRLMAIVDELCRRAEVAGGRMPATPRAIRPELKPMINR